MNSKPTIEVKKASNESNMTLVRRFSRRVTEAGIIRAVKAQRYNERAPSKLDSKTSALNRLKRGKEVERLKKLGKWVERTRGNRPQQSTTTTTPSTSSTSTPAA